MAEGKKIGEVTHYFPKAGAAVVKFEVETAVGVDIEIKGKRGEDHKPFSLKQKIESLQKDHEKVEKASVGDELGMAVEKEVREGDEVYQI